MSLLIVTGWGIRLLLIEVFPQRGLRSNIQTVIRDPKWLDDKVRDARRYIVSVNASDVRLFPKLTIKTMLSKTILLAI